jgi:hypothetical protein
MGTRFDNRYEGLKEKAKARALATQVRRRKRDLPDWDLSTPKTAACGEEAISLTVVGHSYIQRASADFLNSSPSIR